MPQSSLPDQDGGTAGTGPAPDSPPSPEPGPGALAGAARESDPGPDRGDVIAAGLRATAAWALRFVIVVVAVGLLFWLLGRVWVGVLPVVMAVLISTVLWPGVRFLAAHGWPRAAASAFTLVVGLASVVTLGVLIAPSIAEQSMQVAEKAGDGIVTVQQWLAGPPFNLGNEELEEFTGQAGAWLQGQAGDIASSVFSGVAAAGSILVTTVLVLILTFFFLKDGPTFLPWLRRTSGRRAGQHLTEVLSRVYTTLSGFIRTQALVGLIDALFIGLGLVVLGVPLAFALAVLTFFAAFVPVVGAVVAGGFAVLVALVSNGPTTALLVLLVVLFVQQVESNVLLPMLQSRSMDLHAGLVLIAITIGGTVFGVVGAFLAVPVAASLTVVLRYISDQVDLRAGVVTASDLAVATPEGRLAAARVELAAMADRVRKARAAPAPAGEGGRAATRSPSGRRRKVRPRSRQAPQAPQATQAATGDGRAVEDRSAHDG